MSDNYARIFLLSHMRALTSLAGHILGSHPRINGYYEMHISYEQPQALAAQMERFLEHDVLKSGSRYLFDKLLHNEYRLQLDQLAVDRVKVLVALREPEQSIKSIVNLFAQKNADEPYAAPPVATSYYVDRVAALAEYCCSADQDYYYFDSEVLRDDPDVLLPALTRWLELEPPLRASYDIFSLTGESRKGDSSRLIRSGRIDRTERNYSHIAIPDRCLQMAQHIYRDCRRSIIRGAADAVTRAE